ncbi:MAG: hypothetical protein ABEJ89_00665 [Haloarculaceae archaeon]
MRTVRDANDDRRYLLLESAGESSLVRDPETGERRRLPSDRLESVPDDPPLATAAAAVPEPVRRVLTAVHDDRSLGLLLEIDARSPVDVPALAAAADLCESDLNGLVGEFRAAGLIEATEVAGVRGYETTAVASEGLAALADRSGRAPPDPTDGD